MTDSPNSSASRWRKWKQNCVTAASTRNPIAPHITPRGSWREIGPLMTAPIAHASIGNWIDRRITSANSQFRLRACGFV